MEKSKYKVEDLLDRKKWKAFLEQIEDRDERVCKIFQMFKELTEIALEENVRVGRMVDWVSSFCLDYERKKIKKK